MNWKTIAVAATGEEVEALETTLWESGAVSVTLVDGEDKPIFEPGPGETPLWPTMTVTAMYEDDIDTESFAETLRGQGYEVLFTDEVGDRVWEREWLSQFKPMKFGEHLWVCPTGFTVDDSDAVILHLDPGLAFGTGTHPTTGLCLKWLDGHLIPGTRVLDYGCGSGILGIAAKLLGARDIVAVDNDPQALVATEDNAQRNGVQDEILTFLPEAFLSQRLQSEQVQSEQLHSEQAQSKQAQSRQAQPELASLVAEATGQFGVVVANILAQPLISLAYQLSSYVAPGGHLVLSGIMSSQSDWVKNAYQLDLVSEEELDGWVCLHFKKSL
jgi:ribosomal protein L11 methyltransferase